MPAESATRTRDILHSARDAGRSYPFTTLLITELLLILLYPLAGAQRIGIHLMRVLVLTLFVVLLYSVLGRGRQTAIAFILGLPPLLLHAANLFGYLHWERLESGLGVPFLIFVCLNFARNVVSQPRVTSDTLAGAIATYMAIGISYGLIFGFVEKVLPGAFLQTSHPTQQLTPPDLVFFSFVTLTTVGYGNIVPMAPLAKSLCILEAITGVMYPAVLIGRLIGLYATGNRPEH